MTSRSNSAVRSSSAKRGRSATAATPAASPAVRATEATTTAAPVEPIERPSRGFSAVTDDRWTAAGAAAAAAADAAKCGPPCCVANGCTKPEQHYARDRQAAKALAQYLSPDERGKALRWLDVLQHLAPDIVGAGGGTDLDEQSERSVYMTCLLMLLRAGRLVAPFTRAPPTAARPLKPLRDVVDRRLYKRVQIECRRRRLQECARYELDGGGGGAGHRPSEFFDRMPEPSSGVICYGAAFSTM